MTSKAMLTLYTILIVVLVLILFLFVLALVLFRESLESCCCPGFRRRRGQRPLTGRADQREPLGGLRNPGFDEQEQPRRMPEQRPFDPMEAVESPPSYDEAVKQELFRFRPSPATQIDRSFSPTEGAIPEEEPSQTTNASEDGASANGASAACAADHPHSSPISLPSTSYSCTQSSRKRGSSTSGGVASPLSTIREEDLEDWPVTVVIDCIGVQASRLLENCDTSVSLTNGSELGTHSKC